MERDGFGNVESGDLTAMLLAWRDGDGAAFSGVVAGLHRELKAIAAKQLGKFGGSATLSPTELLHEAVLRLMESRPAFENRVHFLATMSLATRSILVDHARARNAQKRGGERIQVTLTESKEQGEASMIADLLALDQALGQLEKLDPRCGKVMHLAFFAGLSREDISATLDISPATVRRDLRFGRSWIDKALAA
jgi:RNA polymerase sigma factor (TIGR02999 family)